MKKEKTTMEEYIEKTVTLSKAEYDQMEARLHELETGKELKELEEECSSLRRELLSVKERLRFKIDDNDDLYRRYSEIYERSELSLMLKAKITKLERALSKSYGPWGILGGKKDLKEFE